MLYFSKKEMNCLKNIPKDFELVSHFFNINESMSIEELSYELILLIKDSKDNYKVAALTRGKYNDYVSLIPFESISNDIFMDYPIKRILKKNNIVSQKYCNIIRNIFKFKLPKEIIEIIISYFCKKEINFDNLNFELKLKNEIKNDTVVEKFFNVFKNNVYLIVTN